ncbi:SpoIID/LytB domain-containing protein [Vulgatibacter incomptus]|uniref:Sporulation stage II protein D amidase enhancer LytB N-terminal domain-containing protein n=1 Tax=Vulgatibacter incomptus TaxID=1391653 RepID=A0A0K1PC99_9BACT|nr:SpoIID/LytB domain-containing protein [Vulgatibacter incomptus]AKU90724.1 hypothetical protein AKJ08_1111 [Vulgatibacter incomptus]
MRRVFAFVVLALLLPSPALAEAMIRIAVAENLPGVAVSAERLRIRPLTDEGTYRAIEGGKASIQRDPSGLVTVDGGGPGVEAIRIRGDGPIAVGDKMVRGSVEVLATPGGLLVVNELPMEVYLAAVLGSEMPPAFPPEALKAQAVAARTYAIGKKLAAEGQPYHLGASVLSQVYGGVHREDPRTHAAVEATEGEVLVFEHAPIEAYFFSSCGGTTEDGGNALSRSLPYLTSHSCPEARDTPGARWSLELSGAELGRRLGLAPLQGISVVSRTASGRVRSVELRTAKGSQRLDAVTLRRRVGYGEIKSLAFDAAATKAGFRFTGKGNGHGAGMCQWGAAAAAKSGWEYRRILEHYYPGTELRRMY